jgi:hypothetical protein
MSCGSDDIYMSMNMSERLLLMFVGEITFSNPGKNMIATATSTA